MNIKIVISSGILITSFVTFSAIAADKSSDCLTVKKANGKVCVTLPGSAKKWHTVAPSFTIPNSYVKNYFPTGQSTTTWKKMIQLRVVSFTFYPSYIRTAKEYITQAQKTLSKNCPNNKWKTLSVKSDTGIYEYQIEKCSWGTQYRVAKVVGHKNFLLEVSYTKKGIATPAEKKAYLKVVTSATFDNAT